MRFMEPLNILYYILYIISILEDFSQFKNIPVNTMLSLRMHSLFDFTEHYFQQYTSLIFLILSLSLVHFYLS